ncbi:MAG TPA: hypothetical protein VNZ22_20335, partial [Bacillota bacterium]|nr:hypothetical protein [Bacillota bacterium]
MMAIPKGLRSTEGTERGILDSRHDAAVAGSQGWPPLRGGGSWVRLLIWTLVAAGAFHAAYLTAHASFLIVFYLLGLVQLAQAETWRRALYSGFAVGVLIAVPQLEFFWRIFSVGAIALWVVYSVWIALFVVMARLCLRRLPGPWNWVLLPVLWCGLEYFRSELYYLRFSWLSPGFAFAGLPGQVPLNYAGTYGLGFLLMGLVCLAAFRWHKSPIQTLAGLALGMGALLLWGYSPIGSQTAAPAAKPLHMAGVQMEFPTEAEVLTRLNDLVRKHPETELIVLSEYTFNDPVPDRIRRWCRDHQRYLIVGAKDPTPDGNFYNTAFVLSPAGEIVFRQVKSVPIQFFKDGIPALEQKLWDAPWGKLG